MRICAILCAALPAVVSSLNAQDSAYQFVEDVVTVQAEDVEYGSEWVFESDIDGYTGSGYLRYVGPERLCDGSAGDLDGTCHGDPADGVRIPILVSRRAAYHVNFRGYHTKEARSDSDPHRPNEGFDLSVYTHVVGVAPPVELSHLNNPGTWWWAVYGPGANDRDGSFSEQTWFVLEPGVHIVYISGRHTNFRLDMVSIYPKTGPSSFPENAHTTTAPLSPLAPTGTGAAPYVAGASRGGASPRAGSSAGVALSLLLNGRRVFADAQTHKSFPQAPITVQRGACPTGRTVLTIVP